MKIDMFIGMEGNLLIMNSYIAVWLYGYCLYYKVN